MKELCQTKTLSAESGRHLRLRAVARMAALTLVVLPVLYDWFLGRHGRASQAIGEAQKPGL